MVPIGCLSDMIILYDPTAAVYLRPKLGHKIFVSASIYSLVDFTDFYLDRLAKLQNDRRVKCNFRYDF
jgi:hypothetical protein